MAVSMFIRNINTRNLTNINYNASNIYSKFIQLSKLNTRSFSSIIEDAKLNSEFQEKPKKKISKAMKAYLERAQEYDAFIKKEVVEYEIGKRHLANMMGEDPDHFTQDDVKRSIEYLFPSGLFDPAARPMMCLPDEIFPAKKEAEFDESGKPYHSMFYTGRPNYFHALHNITHNFKELNKTEEFLLRNGKLPTPEEKINVDNSRWLTQIELEKLFLEKLSEKDYNYFLKSMERLIEHPLSNKASEFIRTYRKIYLNPTEQTVVLPIQHNNEGRPYVVVENCMRKSARGVVTLIGKGTGKITINGQDITYFKRTQDREQVRDFSYV